MISQAYVAPAVAVEATLPFDPAQTGDGADMVQSGAPTSTDCAQVFEQPSLVALRLTV
jgi:hypothetical protein